MKFSLSIADQILQTSVRLCHSEVSQDRIPSRHSEIRNPFVLISRLDSNHLRRKRMRARALLSFAIVTLLMLVIPALAQEGHPLKGSWIGDWGPSKTDRNQVTVVMDWDGKAITG